MSFQRPEFLLALLLALLPAAFYLSRYVRSTRTVFPAAPFLFGRDRTPLARLRSRQIAAMLLRAGIICLAALAFADPVLHSDRGAADRSRSDRTVLVVDLSASMQATGSDGEESFAQVVAAAHRLVAQAPENQLFAVVPCPRLQDKLLWLPRAEAGDALDALTVNGSVCHPLPLLEKLTISVPALTRVHFFSDLQLAEEQRHQLNRLQARTDNLVIESPPFVPAANRRLSSSWHEPGGIGILVETAHEQLPASTATLTCGEEQEPVPIPEVTPGGEAVSIAVPSSLPAGLCRISLADDGLVTDNDTWFTLQAQASTRIIIVDGTPGRSLVASPGELLTAALRAGRGRVNVVRLAQTEFSYDSLDLADLLIFIDPRPLPRYLERGLVEYMARGGQVWFFAGNATAEWSADNLLLPGLQARPCLALPEQPFRVAWVSADDPAAAQLGQLAETSVRQWRHLRHIALTFLGREAAVLARFDDGVPAIVRAPYDRGALLLWSLVPAPDNGNFALHPAFPVAIQAFLEAMARPATTVLIPAVCPVAEPCQPALEPEGATLELTGGADGSRRLTVPPHGEVVCPEAGPYFRTGPEGRELTLVCRTLASEGALHAVAEPAAVAADQPLPPTTSGRRAGPLVPVLLLAALALVIVELWMVSGRLKDRYEA